MSRVLTSAGFFLCEILNKKTCLSNQQSLLLQHLHSYSLVQLLLVHESNISYPDGDYSGATTDLHIGYEGAASEKVAYYVQGGPSFVAVDGTDGSEGEFSGKAGLTVAATDSIGIYGELSGITDEDSSGDDIVNWGAKLGAKFVF